MKMTAPTSPTSHFRLSSNKKFRLTILLSLVAIGATVLASTNSYARSLGQRFFARAAAIVSGSREAKIAPVNRSLPSAEAAPQTQNRNSAFLGGNASPGWGIERCEGAVWRPHKRAQCRSFSAAQVPAGTFDGSGTIRMYGFGSSHSPNSSFASSFETEPAMITSSPCCHWAGVDTL